MAMGMEKKTNEQRYQDQLAQQQVDNQRKNYELGLSERRTKATEQGAEARMITANRPTQEPEWKIRDARADILYKNGYWNKDEYNNYKVTGKAPFDRKEFAEKADITASTNARYRKPDTDKTNPFLGRVLSSLDTVTNRRVTIKTRNPLSALSYSEEGDNFLRAAGLLKQLVTSKLMSTSLTQEEQSKYAQFANPEFIEKVGIAMTREENIKKDENGEEYLEVPGTSLRFKIRR